MRSGVAETISGADLVAGLDCLDSPARRLKRLHGVNDRTYSG